MPYHICEFCGKAIRVIDFKKHKQEKHPDKEPISRININLKKILNESKKKYHRNDKLILNTSFDIAKRIFSLVENIDTSIFSIIYDYEIKEFLEQTISTTHPPHPPLMIHITGVIKDETIYNELLKKYKGTKDEKIVKGLVGSRKEVIICFKNYVKWMSEYRTKGIEWSDIIFLTVYFFLHEFYHIIGEGERMAATNAAMALLKTLGTRIVIPDYEIERWNEYEKFIKKYRAQIKRKR